MLDKDRITKTPGVCGGSACISGTRLPVWQFVEAHRLGATDGQLLASYPELTLDDLTAARIYAAAHPLEIDRALWENEACMIANDGSDIPPDFLRRGRQLGLTDSELREAFEPPLAQSELDRDGVRRQAVGA